MEFALISPIDHLSISSTVCNYHMVLGHLLKNKTYSNFYKQLKINQPDSFIICDNSANEGYMLKGIELINMALSIHADELIAPDKYHDASTTMKETFEFLDSFYESHIENRFKVMAVPQGETPSEYINCFNTFLSDPRIDTIGIGYRNLLPAFIDSIFLITDYLSELNINNADVLLKKLEDNCFNYTLSRLYFLQTYVKSRVLARKKKQIHLLGLYNPIELKMMKQSLKRSLYNKIRSCDSAAPWQAAQAGIYFDKEYGVATKPKEYLDFEAKMSHQSLETFYYNLKLIEEWA